MFSTLPSVVSVSRICRFCLLRGLMLESDSGTSSLSVDCDEACGVSCISRSLNLFAICDRGLSAPRGEGDTISSRSACFAMVKAAVVVSPERFRFGDTGIAVANPLGDLFL